ncbi:type III PLP-dependent enzyme [Haliea sp. E17]|uniref:type III PLP-dependent enzyme n=1 Tax=Haliea sp. E17 TaxID=3401576 RepID=UPI003AAC3639
MANTVKVSPTADAEYYRTLSRESGFSPLLVLDCERLRQQYRSLVAALPGVDMYYAIKSLPNMDVLHTLAAEGAGFDIATSAEAEMLAQVAVSPRHTIHTHPIKRPRDIIDALRYGCTTFVVDNPEEIAKFEPYRQRVSLLLRVSFRSPSALVDLSRKFGCAPQEVDTLLDEAARLGIHVKGLSFHVGSQSLDSSQQVKAIDTCNALIRARHARGLPPLSVLDIGGGFPASYGQGEVDIEAYCEPIRAALDRLPEFVNVLAEPGRFLSAPSMTGVATVMGRALRDGRWWYYFDDGVYGSYSGQLFDHTHYPLEVFSDSAERFPSVLSGPTCDSIDVIAEDLELPELQIGDLLVGHSMGAYTAASATDFNGFPRARVVLVNQHMDEALTG